LQGDGDVAGEDRRAGEGAEDPQHHGAAPGGRARGVGGEDGQARRPAARAQVRSPRAERKARLAGAQLRAGDRDGESEGDRQGDQGQQAQGPGVDPGRRRPRLRQEPRRPAGGDPDGARQAGRTEGGSGVREFSRLTVPADDPAKTPRPRNSGARPAVAENPTRAGWIPGRRLLYGPLRRTDEQDRAPSTAFAVPTLARLPEEPGGQRSHAR